MVTPAMRMMALWSLFLEEKESGSFEFAREKSSWPFILTKPPSGIQFRDQRVFCLPSFLPQALGGSPSPNSSTLTLKSLAVRKCPSSWMTTRREKTARKMMPVMMVMVFVLKKLVGVILADWEFGVVGN